MDNAQKAIMIGVGLFITIIVIAAVMLITGMGQNIVNQGTSQIAGLSAQLENTVTQKYDNKTLTGAEVRAAVQQYWTSSELSIAVADKANSGNIGYAGAKKMTLPAALSTTGNVTATSVADFSSDKTALNTFTDVSLDNGKYYVPASATYKSELVKLNNATIGIVFIKTAD